MYGSCGTYCHISNFISRQEWLTESIAISLTPLFSLSCHLSQSPYTNKAFLLWIVQLTLVGINGSCIPFCSKVFLLCALLLFPKEQILSVSIHCTTGPQTRILYYYYLVKRGCRANVGQTYSSFHHKFFLHYLY